MAYDHFSIGRTALRETLTKLQDQGLLEKSNRSHWIAGSLPLQEVRDAFEVRRLLEPEALAQSAALVTKATFEMMRDKIAAEMGELDETSSEDIENIENDLHQVLQEKTENWQLLEVIHRNQLPFFVNRIFRLNFGLKPDLAMLHDHAEILHQLLRNRVDFARTMLAEHLARAERSTLAKLRVLSTLSKPVTAPCLVNAH